MDAFKLDDNLIVTVFHTPKTGNDQPDLSDVCQNVEENKNVPNDGITELFDKKIKLLKITNELQELSLNLLQQKLSLLDIKNRRDDIIAIMLKDYMNYFQETQNMFEMQAITISLLEKKFKLQELKNDQENDFIVCMIEEHMDYLYEIQKALEERKRPVQVSELLKNTKDEKEIENDTVDSCLKYLETYKKCVFFIEEAFQKTAETSSSVQKLFSTISTLEKLLNLCKEIQVSSKRNYDDGKSATNADSDTPEGETSKLVHLLIAATEKAEFAYTELKAVVFELTNMDSI